MVEKAQEMSCLRVKGMTCAACEHRVKQAVSKVEGVKQVEVNLLTGQVRYEGEASLDEVKSAIRAAGYELASDAMTPSSPTESGEEKVALRSQIGMALSEVAEESKKYKRQFILSLLFFLPLFYLAMGPMLHLPLPSYLLEDMHTLSYALLQFLLCLPLLYINRRYFIKGFRALAHLGPTMDSLVAIGVAAAVTYGVVLLFVLADATTQQASAHLHHLRHQLYFEGGGMILCLITLGRWLESRSRVKTGSALQGLEALMPEEAWREGEDGQPERCRSIDLKIADVCLIHPGARIPVDGYVVSGFSTVDESAMTGESLPCEKEVGDQVLAGTLNQQGYLRVKAEKVGQQSALAQMIHLVEEASSSKAPIARLADRIAAVFVPTVILLAAVTFGIWFALKRDVGLALQYAISVLIISCPCALGLATPLAILLATGKAAERGILIRRAAALEAFQKVKVLLFDKTGTLTKGSLVVTTCYWLDETLSQAQKHQLLGRFYALEAKSEHVLADAFCRYVQSERARLAKDLAWQNSSSTQAGADGLEEEPIRLEEPIEMEHFLAHAGRGVEGEYQGQRYLAGNWRFLQEQQVRHLDSPLFQEALQTIQQRGETWIALAENGVCKLLLAFADEARETARGAVQRLQAEGIQVQLLTGDNTQVAQRLAEQLGIDQVHAACLPADKAKQLQILRKQAAPHLVAMVGDGVNDAPALAQADVAVAIGSGTDIAQAAADVILMRADPEDVWRAWQLSRVTIRNIKQNLFWAFFYNICGIPLAAGALSHWGLHLNPMWAALAMSLSSLFVVSNALRLQRQADKAMGVIAKREEEEADKTANTPIQDGHLQAAKRLEDNRAYTYQLDLEGLSCQHCVARCQKALEESFAEVQQIEVESLERFCIHSEKELEEAKVADAIQKAGYQLRKMEVR